MRKLCRRGDDHDSGSHGSRPWVYFMIDCFFLITFFILVTFQFKREEHALPQKMPPGIRPLEKPYVRCGGETIPIHVSPTGYALHGKEMGLFELEQTLASAAQHGGSQYTVKVSYEPLAQWGDVLAVFNACKKVKIENCGMKPLRDPDAH